MSITDKTTTKYPEKVNVTELKLDAMQNSISGSFRNKQLEREIKKLVKKNHYNCYKEYLKKASNYRSEGICAAIGFCIKARINYRLNILCSKIVCGESKLIEMRILRVDDLIYHYKGILRSEQLYKDTEKCTKIISRLREQKKMLEMFI